MSVEDNITVIKRIVDEVWNKGNTSVLSELLAPEYAWLTPEGRTLEGPSGYERLVNIIRTAFPDRHAEIEDYVGDGDKLAVRFVSRGTFLGKLRDREPTGRSYVSKYAIFYYFEDGKVVRESEYITEPTFQQQVGIAT